MDDLSTELGLVTRRPDSPRSTMWASTMTSSGATINPTANPRVWPSMKNSVRVSFDAIRPIASRAGAVALLGEFVVVELAQVDPALVDGHLQQHGQRELLAQAEVVDPAARGACSSCA